MTVPEKIPKEKYQEMVNEKLEHNHIWLNKMVYFIHPTDEEKIRLADMILYKLNTRSTQIPADGITDDSELMREMAVLTPMLYLRVNWS